MYTCTSLLGLWYLTEVGYNMHNNKSTLTIYIAIGRFFLGAFQVL